MSYSPLSADSVRGHPARFLRAGDSAEWTSILVQEMILASSTSGFHKPATDDSTLVVQTSGSGHLEVDGGDGWEGADRHAGSVGFAPHAQAMQVRWKTIGSAPLRTVHVYLPHAIMTAAEEEFRITGRSAGAIPFSAIGFGDAVIHSVTQRLLHAIDTLEPDIYAQSAARFLAAHLQTVHRFASDGDGRTVRVPSDRRIARVIDRMRGELDQPLTIDDLAREACVSPFHFGRLFKTAVGDTPARFLTKLRMERAAALLRKEDMPISLIAVPSGYRNHAAFTSAFRRWSGRSPTDWRTGTQA